MALYPFDGITTEPHLIYSADSSATGTIPLNPHEANAGGGWEAAENI